jgi:hypothetical protein
LDQVVTRRYGALYPDAFVTYRRDKTGEKPTKVWSLTADCEIGQLFTKPMIVPNGKWSTVWALAARQYKELQMVRTSIKPLGCPDLLAWLNQGKQPAQGRKSCRLRQQLTTLWLALEAVQRLHAYCDLHLKQ